MKTWINKDSRICHEKGTDDTIDGEEYKCHVFNEHSKLVIAQKKILILC